MLIYWTKKTYIIVLISIIYIFIRTECCSELPSVPHAFPVEKLTPPIEVWSGVRYDCESGYKIVNGSQVAVCQEVNGTTFWKPPTLICELEGCSSLPQLHQKVPKEDDVGNPPFPIGTTISYKCDFGYYPEGGSTDAVCILKSGRAQWELPNLSCKGVSCGDPKVVKHARRIGDVFNFPHNVTYICNDGYETDDTNVMHCLPTSVWSHNRPVCNAVQCHPLKNPENGFVDVKELTYRSIAKYRCNDEYRLEGHAERECMANKSWTGAPPNCTLVTCLPITEIPNGRAIPLPSLNSVIISCNPPDSRKFTVKCSHGEWLPPVPKCTGKSTTETPFTTMEPTVVITEPGIIIRVWNKIKGVASWFG